MTLVDGKAKAAATYTESFCDGIIDGIQMYYDFLDDEANSGTEEMMELMSMGEDMCDPDETTIPFTFT